LRFAVRRVGESLFRNIRVNALMGIEAWETIQQLFSLAANRIRKELAERIE
jgi:hypothetical protein